MSNHNECIDNNIPTVDEESIECCSLTPASCIVTTEYNSFLKIGIGKTLSYVINRIAIAIKKNLTKIETLEALHNYKEYEALLTQALLVAPVPVIGKNELSATPVYTYVSPGKYDCTLLGAFPATKTFIYLGTTNLGWDDKVKAYRVSDDVVRIESGNSGDYVDDNIITNLPFRIKVYN